MPGADPKTILAAVEWMWSHRGNNMFWRPGVLTEELNKQDPSAPKVTINEAESIFLQLLERGLVYVKPAPDRLPAFWMHESKINQWKSFIAELKTDLVAENKSNNGTSDEPQNHQRSNDNPLFGEGSIGRFIRSGIEVASGIGLYAFGDDCTNWGHIYWGFFFHYLCIVIAALSPVEHAIAVWPNRKSRI
jgi:hypothetical protein